MTTPAPTAIDIDYTYTTSSCVHVPAGGQPVERTWIDTTWEAILVNAPLLTSAPSGQWRPLRVTVEDYSGNAPVPDPPRKVTVSGCFLHPDGRIGNRGASRVWQYRARGADAFDAPVPFAADALEDMPLWLAAVVFDVAGPITRPAVGGEDSARITPAPVGGENGVSDGAHPAAFAEPSGWTLRVRNVGPAWSGSCTCVCNSGGFCGGCGHAGCGGRLS